MIFLDIDGVLNSAKWYKERMELDSWNSVKDNDSHELDPYCVNLLMDFIKSENDVKIVFISAWIKLEGWESDLYINGVELEEYYQIDTDGHRYDAIQEFIDDYEIKNYVIVDDDYYDKYIEIFGKEKVIRTFWQEGLRVENMNEIKNILKQKESVYNAKK